MGRRPTRPDAVPRLRKRRQKSGHVCYYYDHGIVDGKRREEALGSDYGLAVKRWAEIEHASDIPAPAVLTFAWVAGEYMKAAEADQLPRKKAARTLSDNRKEVKKLLEFFNDPPAPLEAIAPVNVRQYLTWRGKTAKIRANREKALLSGIWNFARDKGYTSLPNPCAGIKGFEETGRDVYLEDVEYRRIWEQADVCLRDAMDLAYLTGQRPADVLRMAETDLRDGVLQVRQGKTRTPLRVEVVGELVEVIERLRARKHAHKVYSTRLVVNEHGRPIGTNAMSRRWVKACTAAKVSGLQFRDLRAKAGTDKTDSAGDIRQAQRQLGHGSVVMTEHYVRKRRGEKVTPTR
jgi:integrase